MKTNWFLLIYIISISSVFAQKKWTLKECINHAVKNNITVQQGELDKKIVEITKKDAVGAFLPNINASANHSWNIGLNQNITTGLLENQTTQFTSVGLNANVAIFKGLQNVNQLRKANLSIIANQYQLTKIQEDIALNVANAFLQIVFNKEALKVQQEQYKLLEKQFQRTNELVKAGNIPKGDLLEVEANKANTKQQLIIAENNLFLSRLSLAQLLRVDDFKNFDIIDESNDIVLSNVLNETPEAIWKQAKLNRTELKIAMANLQIAQKDIDLAKGAYLPTLTGFYSFSSRASNAKGILFDSGGVPIGTKGPDPIFDQFDTNKGQNFGLALNIPIFNGFATRNNVQRMKVNWEKNKLNLAQQELDLERVVYTAFTDTKAAKESYESALIALNSRKLALEYAKERYEVGLMNVFDYNQVQNTFVSAQSEVLRTKYNFIFRTKILEFYFGIPLIDKQ